MKLLSLFLKSTHKLANMNKINLIWILWESRDKMKWWKYGKNLKRERLCLTSSCFSELYLMYLQNWKMSLKAWTGLQKPQEHGSAASRKILKWQKKNEIRGKKLQKEKKMTTEDCYKTKNCHLKTQLSVYKMWLKCCCVNVTTAIDILTKLWFLKNQLDVKRAYSIHMRSVTELKWLDIFQGTIVD